MNILDLLKLLSKSTKEKIVEDLEETKKYILLHYSDDELDESLFPEIKNIVEQIERNN